MYSRRNWFAIRVANKKSTFEKNLWKNVANAVADKMDVSMQLANSKSRINVENSWKIVKPLKIVKQSILVNIRFVKQSKLLNKR